MSNVLSKMRELAISGGDITLAEEYRRVVPWLCNNLYKLMENSIDHHYCTRLHGPPDPNKECVCGLREIVERIDKGPLR